MLTMKHVPLARILVDGYSLLHAWPELAPGKARHSAAARAELILILQQYRDAIGTPLTVVFDGAGAAPAQADDRPSTPEMEIIYSKTGQTADDIIERVTHLLRPYGEVLVISNDFAERDTVITFGGHVMSCQGFISTVESTLKDFNRQLQAYNRKERGAYKAGGQK
jgi:predicted RNA-binding protein with PIN domain